MSGVCSAHRGHARGCSACEALAVDDAEMDELRRWLVERTAERDALLRAARAVLNSDSIPLSQALVDLRRAVDACVKP